MTELQRLRILNALTEYDRKQSRKRGHNPYALALYCKALTNVAKHCENGAELRLAILNCFEDRLLDIVLKSVDLPISTIDENRFKIYDRLPNCYLCNGTNWVNDDYCPDCDS